jgi:hypothetical protein
VPKALILQTKPQLAVEMLCLLAGEDVLPFMYVVPNCLQGQSPKAISGKDSPSSMPSPIKEEGLCELNTSINAPLLLTLPSEEGWGTGCSAVLPLYGCANQVSRTYRR